MTKPIKTTQTVEQAWYHTHDASEAIKPEYWERLIATRPLGTWRPDTPVNSNESKEKETSLVELWMRKARESNDHDQWLLFFENLIETFPDLNKEAVKKTLWIGLKRDAAFRKTRTNTPYENILKKWVSAFHETWEQDLKDALLNQSVELNLLNLTKDLIKLGGNASQGLRFIRTKDMYELLIRQGADPAQKTVEDKRLEMKDYTPVDGLKKDWSPIKETIAESLISKNEDCFLTRADQKKTIKNLLSGSWPISEDQENSRSKMLFQTIESSREEEIFSAIRSNLPHVWQWKSQPTTRKPAMNVLHALVFAGKIHVLEALFKKYGQKIPEACFSEKDSKGASLLERIIKENGINGVGVLFFNEKMLSKIIQTNPPIPEQTIKMMVEFGGGKEKQAKTAVTQVRNQSMTGCPINDLTIQKEYKEITVISGYQKLTGCSEEDFWAAEESYSNKKGRAWVEEIAESLWRSTITKVNIQTIKEWCEVLNKKPKEFFSNRPEWATVAMVTEYANHAGSDQFFGAVCKDPLVAKRVLVKWLPCGAKSSRLMSLFGGDELQIMAVVERELLGKPFKKSSNQNTSKNHIRFL